MNSKSQSKNILALFDFDGTITYKDSFFEFLRHCFGNFRTILGLIIMSPIIFGYLFKIISNNRAKEKLFTYFFKDMPEEVFSDLGRSFSINEIDNFLRPEAMKRIDWHKNKNHRVIVVSASIEDWLLSWCEQNDIELISTRVELKDGLLTGRFDTPNCYGEEKVRRLKAIFSSKNYIYKYAYGDSEGDRELLQLAENAYYKTFR